MLRVPDTLVHHKQRRNRKPKTTVNAVPKAIDPSQTETTERKRETKRHES